MSRVRRWAPVAYPGALLALTALGVVAPQRDGPLALAQVFLPWLYLPLLALLPHAALLRDRLLLLGLAACALAFGVHLGPEYVPSGRSTSDTAGARRLTVTSWNVLVSNSPAAVTAGVRALDSDVVGLVELTPRQARFLATDPVVTARWPYRVLVPEQGRALLSKRPVRARGVAVDPAARPGSAVLWARLDGITVAVAHPLPASMPPSYDTTRRDAEIAFTRRVTDGLPGRVLLVGDFNVTDREPGARTLVTGLHDAHAEVGWGAGNSWAPLRVRERGMALVRIDRALGGPGVVPAAVHTDCGWRGSDHCMVTAAFEVSSP